VEAEGELSLEKQLSIEASGLTDKGIVRRNNEDAILIFDRQEPNVFGVDSFGIYLVADGMGGHQGGEVASEAAKQTISSSLLENLKLEAWPRSPFQLLKEAVERAHFKILRIAQEKPKLRSMGTTVTVGLRLGLELYIGHVGDSRAYLIRNREIQQLTEDHSLVATLLKKGAITPDEVRAHPDRGKIIRCLGVSPYIAVDTRVQNLEKGMVNLNAGDCLVFCSDGLSTCVHNNEILDRAVSEDNPDQVCRGLVDLANSRGGEDNISVIVVKVKE